ncbi:MAG: hypothetical protein HFG54_06855 [Lachnospiraceae bacterium]|jgi:uncharacterized membrane protein (DUF485 family)|nr:hypothetical protein [Lachnospiraceae bacterium]
MEPNHIQSPKTKSGNLPLFSMIVGVFALFACMSPPMQLLFGSTALIIAYLSRQGRPMSGPAVAGTIMGICGILCSFVMLGFYVLTIRMMDNPDFVAMQREIMKQYQDMFDAFGVK